MCVGVLVYVSVYNCTYVHLCVCVFCVGLCVHVCDRWGGTNLDGDERDRERERDREISAG